MKVRYLGETDILGLTHHAVYEVITVEDGPADTKWYRIVLEDDDDDGSGLEGYLYWADDFEIVDDAVNNV